MAYGLLQPDKVPGLGSAPARKFVSPHHERLCCRRVWRMDLDGVRSRVYASSAHEHDSELIEKVLDLYPDRDP